MRDFLRRLIIVGIMALFISLLFIGGKQSQADMVDLEDRTKHWIWPTDGVVTDTYGTRNGNHNGLDIAGEYNSPVYAVDGGEVTKSYYSGSYGHVVFIKHSNGLETVYAHLGERIAEEGQLVKQGELIGKMGSTGHSSGVHLHFEVHENNWTIHKENAINPVKVIGNVAVGETVQAIMRKPNRVAGMAAESMHFSHDHEGLGEEVAGVSVTEQAQAMEEDSEEEVAGSVLESVAKVSSFEEMKFLLYSDYLLLKGIDVKQDSPSLQVADTNNYPEKVEKEDNMEEIVHVVKKGESLWDIAEKYNSSFVKIMEKNKLESEMIHPNETLVIEMDAENSYIVQPGDNLTTIANHHNKTIEELREINHLQSDLIFPQQILLIDRQDE